MSERREGTPIGKRMCAQCGQRRNHADHMYDHRYVDPRQPGLNPIGAGRTRFYKTDAGKEYAARVEELRKGETPCQIQSPVCTGVAQHLHEILSRGRAGGIAAAIEKGPRPIECCDSCNSYVSENPVWAMERGLLRHAWDETEDK